MGARGESFRATDPKKDRAQGQIWVGPRTTWQLYEGLKEQLEQRGSAMSFCQARTASASYGLGRFPFPLYYEQWVSFWDLREFLESNKER